MSLKITLFTLAVCAMVFYSAAEPEPAIGRLDNAQNQRGVNNAAYNPPRTEGRAGVPLSAAGTGSRQAKAIPASAPGAARRPAYNTQRGQRRAINGSANRRSKQNMRRNQPSYNSNAYSRQRQ